MYLIYADESGKPVKTNENFVVAAVIINESKWIDYENKITELRKKFFGDNWELYELHTVDIVHGKSMYAKMSSEIRKNLLAAISSLLASFDVRIVASIIKTNRIYGGVNIESLCMTYFFERLTWNINDLNAKLKASGTNEQYGIVILDSINHPSDESTRRRFRRFCSTGTSYEDNTYLIEDAIFTQSHWRNLIQLADFCAYVINHHFKINQNKDADIKKILEDSYSVIYAKISSQSVNTAYSLKVFPKNSQG